MIRMKRLALFRAAHPIPSTGPSPISLLDADFCAARSGLHSEDDDIRKKKKKKNEKERNNAIYKQLKRQTTSTNRC